MIVTTKNAWGDLCAEIEEDEARLRLTSRTLVSDVIAYLTTPLLDDLDVKFWSMVDDLAEFPAAPEPHRLHAEPGATIRAERAWA